MTTLDQAFIKAYGLSEGIPVPTIGPSSRPIPLSQAIQARVPASAAPSTEACREAAARARRHDRVGLPRREAVDAIAERAAQVRPAPVAKGELASPPEPTDQAAAPKPWHRLDAPGVLGRGTHLSLDQLDPPRGVGGTAPERPANVAPTTTAEADEVEEAIDAEVIEPDGRDEAAREDSGDEPLPRDRKKAPAAEDTATEAEGSAETETAQSAVSPAGLDSPPDVEPEVREEQPAEATSAGPPAEPEPALDGVSAEEEKDASRGAGPFEPALQTDRFDWPAVCDKLTRCAEPQIGRLADALHQGLQRGRKLVGLGGLTRGEGCTTLSLCVARQLAARGLRILVVDADAERPQVAASLGLAPEATWQDLSSGKVPLEEVVIESVEDRLAVLPCRQEASRRGRAALWADATTLARLRSGYDLVLVDLGPLNRKPLVRHLAESGAIDAVLLVHNVRTTPTKQIVRLSQRLAQAGIAQAGVAENFVPASAPVSS